MDKDKTPNRNDVVAGIFDQARGESDAMKDYQKFLSMFGNVLHTADKETIIEIINDEMNHNTRLLAMAKKYGSLKPAEDGLEEALKYLGKK